MKKILSLLMVSVMVLSLLALTACDGGDKGNGGNGDGGASTLKLGLGVTTSVSVKDATSEKNGNGKATITAAAVLVDNDGKIVKVFIDCAESTVSHTATGEAVAAGEFKTKYEKGFSYGMVSRGGAAKEWFEQVDAFCALIVGKNATDVKALVASDNYGTSDVQTAGCTILINDIAVAVEKAIANAVATNATSAAAVKLGVSTSQTPTNATTEKAGSNKLESTFFAAAVDAEGKVIAATSDCVQVTFTFTQEGAATLDTTKEIKSKKELGDSYNMKLLGGAAKEWYEQAAAFDALCAGKTVAQIEALMASDYKGTADVQAAGCTIYVSGFVAAASKIK